MYTNFLIFNILFFILINVGELSDGVKKILLNWLQVSSMAAAFPLKWPAAMQGPRNVASSETVEFVSI